MDICTFLGLSLDDMDTYVAVLLTHIGRLEIFRFFPERQVIEKRKNNRT